MNRKFILKLPQWLHGEHIAPLIVFIVVYLLYEFTRARGIFWGDAGEFLATSRTLGIGHPYGHPLFWLLGRLSIILTPFSPEKAMAHLTALFGAGTAMGVAFFAREFLLESNETGKRILIIITTALTFAVMETVWIQATFIEVYHLQALLVVSALIFFQRYLYTGNMQLLYLSAFLGGLAVTLGIYILLFFLLPILIFTRQKSYLNSISVRRIITILFFFVLGLSIWLYLPFRSVSQPVFAWANIQSWSAYYDYLSRQMYDHLAIAGAVAWKISLLETFHIIFRNIGIWGGFLFFLWLWRVIKEKKSRIIWPYPVAALLIILIFSFLIPCTLSYRQMVDMDVYFLPVFLFLVPVLVSGLLELNIWLKNRSIFLILLPVLLIILWQWSYIDLSNKNLTERFQQYLVNNIPAGSTIILASDEVAYPLFDVIYLGPNSKQLHLPLPHEIQIETVVDTTAGIRPPYFFELHNRFVEEFFPNYEFFPAGPLVVHREDSAYAVNLEKKFISRFNPDTLDITHLSRLDRLSMARIWARRGVYWFKMYFYDETAGPSRNNNLQQALNSFHYASRLDDFSLEGALHAANLALTLTWNKDLTKAETAARKALKLNSHSSLAHRANYFISVKRQAYNKALYHLKKALYLSQTNAEDYIKLATLYCITGKLEEGRTAYQKALSSGIPPQPDLEKILNRLKNE